MIGTEFPEVGNSKPDCGLAILAGSSTPDVKPLYKSETENLNHGNSFTNCLYRVSQRLVPTFDFNS